MIICSCNVFSDADVRDAVNSAFCPQTPSAVYKCLGCNPSCGRCLASVRAILNESLVEPAVKKESGWPGIEDAAARSATIAKSVPSLEPDRIAACGGPRRLFAII